MLDNLTIKNLALIKEESIDFRNGLNVLLGETGSGKSLVFDAINFVIGINGDKSLLRTGEDQMRVDAMFSNLSSATKDVLNEFELDFDDLLITRTLNSEGRSSFKLNGMPATSSMIKAIAKTLLDGLVQHEGIELLKSKNHLQMVDKFGGSVISELKNQISAVYLTKKDIEKQIQGLGGSSEERERMIDLLTYQINEIDKAGLVIGEDDEIKEKLDILNNSEKIFESVLTATKTLSSDTFSALNQVNSGISDLNGIANINVIKECLDRLISLRYELDDICETLIDIKDSTSYDENEFQRLDSRYDMIKSMKKKYGKGIAEILSYKLELRNRLDNLISSEEILSKLTKQLSETEEKILSIAKKLSDERKKIAISIENRVIKELADLGMKGTAFKVAFKEKDISIDGIDNVEFVFSANIGENMKNLSKTASGGEASRIMLAFKNIFTAIDGVSTLVFDEVDSGISGEIGNMVADKLLNISKNSQVLCITHLPQVASLADNFYLVEKKSDGENTISSIKQIKEDAGIIEVAKLVTGNKITDTAINTAKELRERKASIV